MEKPLRPLNFDKKETRLLDFVRDPEQAARTILSLAEAFQNIDLEIASKEEITSIMINTLKGMDLLVVKNLCTLHSSFLIELPWVISGYMNGDIYRTDHTAHAKKFYDLCDELRLGEIVEFGDFYEQQDVRYVENIDLTPEQWATIEAFCAQITPLWRKFSETIVPHEEATHNTIDTIIASAHDQLHEKLSPLEKYIFVLGQMGVKKLRMEDTRSTNSTLQSYAKKTMLKAELFADELEKQVLKPQSTTLISRLKAEECNTYLQSRLAQLAFDVCNLTIEAFNELNIAAWQKYRTQNHTARNSIESFLWQSAEIGHLPQAWLFVATRDKLTQLEIGMQFDKEEEEDTGKSSGTRFLPRKGRGIPLYATQDSIDGQQDNRVAMLTLYPKLAFNMLILAGKLNVRRIYEEFQDLIYAATPNYEVNRLQTNITTPSSSRFKRFKWVTEAEREMQSIKTLRIIEHNTDGAQRPFYYINCAKLEDVQGQLSPVSVARLSSPEQQYLEVANLALFRTVKYNGEAFLPLNYIPGYKIAELEILSEAGHIDAENCSLFITPQGEPILKLPSYVDYVYHTYKLIPTSNLESNREIATRKREEILARPIHQAKLKRLVRILNDEVGWESLAAALQQLMSASKTLTLQDFYKALWRMAIYADFEIHPFASPISSPSLENISERKQIKNTLAFKLIDQIKFYIEQKAALTCFEAAAIAEIFTVELFPDLTTHLVRPNLKSPKDETDFCGSHTSLWFNFAEEQILLELVDTTPAQHQLLRHGENLRPGRVAKLHKMYPQLTPTQLLELLAIN